MNEGYEGKTTMGAIATSNEYPLMHAAGYLFENGAAYAPGPHRQTRVRRSLWDVEGRLHNLAYMAAAIDLFDLRSTDLAPNWNGARQFDFFMNGDEKANFMGYLYVALRRLQRAGNLAGLRAGLALLFAEEDGIITLRDAVSAIAPDLIQKHDYFDDGKEKALTRASQIEDKRLSSK